MRFSIRTLIWTTVLLALILAGSFALIPKPVNVEVALVSEGPLRVTVQQDGKTRIGEKYIVSTPVAGRLSRIELRSGDEVAAEDTLIAVVQPSDPEMLDARARARADAQVQGAEAAVQRSESNSSQVAINHELAKSKYERAKRLLSSKAIADDEYDIARAEFLASEQAIKTAKFESEIARFELEMARAASSQFTDEKTESSVKPFKFFRPSRAKCYVCFRKVLPCFPWARHCSNWVIQKTSKSKLTCFPRRGAHQTWRGALG